MWSTFNKVLTVTLEWTLYDAMQRTVSNPPPPPPTHSHTDRKFGRFLTTTPPKMPEGWHTLGDMLRGQAPSSVLQRTHVAGTVLKLVHTKWIARHENHRNY